MKKLALQLMLPLLCLNGCASAGNLLNPFYEEPSPVALLGEKNDRALNGESDNEVKARAAFEALGSYQQAHAPNPYKPVRNPAVIRLMWIPDHLNKFGDLVPAHYYYVKVKSDQFAVTDAFEIEGQLGSSKHAGSSVPYINADQSIR
jgi:hypothetical protein